MRDLECKFERAIGGMITSILRETKYKPTLFMQMVKTHGAMDACLRLVRMSKPSDGFTTLWELGRLDLTAEAHMIAFEFEQLFADIDLESARGRLLAYGFDPEKSR